MSTPFIGEVRMFGGNFAPQGWAFCNGQVVAIVQNEALFSLLGTTYGGDGIETFRLPDLQGRVPIHRGGSFSIGDMAGSETVTLTASQIPAHSHPAQGDASGGTQASPAGAVWAASGQVKQFTDQAPDVDMAVNALSASGSSLPHDNMLPFLAISFIIALYGVYPSQN